MKFTVIFARYGITGVPLAQIRLAVALKEAGHEVDVIIGYLPSGTKLPQLDGINIIVLNSSKVRFILFKFSLYLLKNKPDVIFTAEDHLNLIIFFCAIITYSKVKISASSRVNPYDTYSNKIFSKRWFLKIFMSLLMWRANVLTCVSKDMVLQYKNIFKNSKHLCVYNIINTLDLQNKAKSRPISTGFYVNKKVKLVAAGQLGPWKGFDDLIMSISFLVPKYNISLSIFGEGNQRFELQKLIDDLNLNPFIKLEGQVEDLFSYLILADVFVLSSLLEGMPNVLIEAMIAGCTPVSTDCPTGPKEILETGRFGYLVPTRSPELLANAIERAILCPISVNDLRKAVLPFSTNLVLDRHFKLLKIE